MRQDYEASKGVVITLRSGGCNMGTQRLCVPTVISYLSMKVCF